MKCPVCVEHELNPTCEGFCPLCRGAKEVHPSTCTGQHCQAQILFVRSVKTNKVFPIDAGSYQHYTPGSGKMVCEPVIHNKKRVYVNVVKMKVDLGRDVDGFTAHHITCPDARNFRKVRSV